GPETEVLAGVYLHRHAERERRADRVGSATGLAPVGPRHEPNVEAAFHRAGVPFALQDHAGRIGEHHDGPRLREEIVRFHHDASARLDELAVAAAQDEEFLRRKDLRCPLAAGVYGQGETTLPRALDDAPEPAWKQRAAADEALPRPHDRA